MYCTNLKEIWSIIKFPYTAITLVKREMDKTGARL